MFSFFAASILLSLAPKKKSPGLGSSATTFIEIEIGSRFDRHHLLVAHTVDEKVFGGHEEILLQPVGHLLYRGDEDARVNLLTQIGDVARIAPIVLEVLHQIRFKRQNLTAEPRFRALLRRARFRAPRMCLRD
jgi:hypothetical protein